MAIKQYLHIYIYIYLSICGTIILFIIFCIWLICYGIRQQQTHIPFTIIIDNIQISILLLLKICISADTGCCLLTGRLNENVAPLSTALFSAHILPP